MVQLVNSSKKADALLAKCTALESSLGFLIGSYRERPLYHRCIKDHYIAKRHCIAKKHYIAKDCYITGLYQYVG